MYKKLTFLVCLILFLGFQTLEAQNLKRKASLGIKLKKLTDSAQNVLKVKKGALVRTVTENSTASKLGLKENDVILKFNNVEIETYITLISLSSELREGDKVEVVVWRNAKEVKLNAIAATVPYEKSEKMDIIYDEVAFQKGFLRIIVNKPKKEGKFPTILFFIACR